MLINEIFYSLQGEGLLAGTPSVFIRLAGCPLHCKWCDTKYAWDNTLRTDYTVDQITESILQYKTKFVVITGGEPMITPDAAIKSNVPDLVKALKDCHKHITIETAGIAFIPNLHCDLMSISPKLSNSTPDDKKLAKIHENARLDLAVLGALIDEYNYQLKFVVDSPDDLNEIKQIIEDITNVNPQKVMLMPQAKTRDQYIAKAPMVADLCKNSGFLFGPRLQVMLWDNQKSR